MLLMKLALMNVFYSIWLLQDIIFHKKFWNLIWGFFQPPSCCFAEDSFNHHVVHSTPYFIHYAHNNSTMLIAMFQYKAIAFHTSWIFLLIFLNKFRRAPSIVKTSLYLNMLKSTCETFLSEKIIGLGACPLDPQ